MGSLLKKMLKNVFDREEYQSALQKEACEVIYRESRDAVICTLSESEKVLCMQLPSAAKGGKFTVVVTPTREFAKSQVSYLKTKNIPAFYWNGCSSTKAKYFIKNEITSNSPKIKLLYLTYKQVLNSHVQFKLIQAKGNLSKFIIDEAQYLSPQNTEFRNPYIKLGILKKKFSEVPFVALTTGATEKVGEDIIQVLQLQSPLILDNRPVKEDFNEHEVIVLESDSEDSIEFIGEERCTTVREVCQHLKPSIKLFRVQEIAHSSKLLVGEECPSCHNTQEHFSDVLKEIEALVHDDSEDSVVYISDDSVESPLLFSD
ncbi:ATP-dependent DNA helicase Q5 isoform X2 [Nasonia vitripennis]|uniref:Helicase ATP-binding domain-containing protein n=2 Tax=Nasonia vitripennis TaxID=7425 RepID=A0A7M7J5X2_NASVI|nr:ATP-dependent DNA helicase Q5 isoform X2 [Nasonia vitripennis]